MVDPVAERLVLPPEYGAASELLEWSDVRARLEGARVYWVSSIRPGGRPHVVPRDGIWIDDTLYYGGSARTVHNRNIAQNPAVTVHIGGGTEAVIVDGDAGPIAVDQDVAAALAAATNTKYADYNLNVTAATYLRGDVLGVRALRVLAWTLLSKDATRFVFPRRGG